MRCTSKYLNCTAHAIDDQNNGRWVSANQPMIEHRPHAIQLYLDQWCRPDQPILIYNSVLKWQHANLKNGARTPRTVTKFAVKTAIDLTKVIKGWNFNFRPINIVFCEFFELIFLTGGTEPN